MTKPLESKIESYLRSQVKGAGGLCYKFKSTVSGVPDQIVIYKGHTYLVEVKRPGETPRANQVHIHNKIRQQGVDVHVVDTEHTVDTFMRDVLRAEVTDKRSESEQTVIKSFFS